jgi:hypothetical protein
VDGLPSWAQLQAPHDADCSGLSLSCNRCQAGLAAFSRTYPVWIVQLGQPDSLKEQMRVLDSLTRAKLTSNVLWHAATIAVLLAQEPLKADRSLFEADVVGGPGMAEVFATLDELLTACGLGSFPDIQAIIWKLESMLDYQYARAVAYLTVGKMAAARLATHMSPAQQLAYQQLMTHSTGAAVSPECALLAARLAGAKVDENWGDAGNISARVQMHDQAPMLMMIMAEACAAALGTRIPAQMIVLGEGNAPVSMFSPDSYDQATADSESHARMIALKYIELLAAKAPNPGLTINQMCVDTGDIKVPELLFPTITEMYAGVLLSSMRKDATGQDAPAG